MDNIESKEAIKLSEKWGDNPCDHPAFGQEIHKAVLTGSYICMQCGAELSKKELDDIENKRD